MKLNASTIETMKDVLAELREKGYGIDLMLSDTQFNRDVSFKALEGLYRYLSDEKIPTSCHLPYIDLHFGSRDPKVHEYTFDCLDAGLEMASVLHAQIAVLHLGFSSHIPPKHREGWQERIVDSLRQLVVNAEEEEIIVAIENTYEPDGELIRDILGQVNSQWLRFCADLGHAACYSRMAPEEWIESFKKEIVLLHFHDNDGLDNLHATCGDGVVGYEPVFEACKAAELSCPIVLEVPEDGWDNSIEHLTEVGFEFGEIPDPTFDAPETKDEEEPTPSAEEDRAEANQGVD
jgi:sugar phosphate isomerase/epimerase